MLLEAHGGDICQVLMHLQMCSEKLVKGYFPRSGIVPPRTHQAVHNHFPYLSAAVTATPNIRRAVMGRSATRAEVSQMLASLEATMRHIEALNPVVAERLAGQSNVPNCEYPWESIGPPPVGHPPARHRFGRSVGVAARAKLYRLLDRILMVERV
jgi:hypothetical protein